MTVRLNQTLYVVITSRYSQFVLKTKVYMKNKTHFIIDCALDDDVIEGCRMPFDIERDYLRNYFKTLKDAKLFFAKENKILKKEAFDDEWDIIKEETA